ncbi:MFS transporter [Exiguobacterium sp. TNDT2]|uniref:MFS transporter n=1 Tax=Exiguobacterium sp. TNDT2 TaxID=2233531 RepID=UPI001E30948B|nr:MFS transporter [Exiguobacterium sp. TNDT2]
MLLGWIRWFDALIPAYTIERLFWESRTITIQEVVYLEMIYAVLVVMLEVPRGVLADRFERRRLMQIGVGLECLSFIVLLLSFSFVGFAVAIALSGIGAALRSGAENSLLYETLEQDGKPETFERWIGRLNVIGIVAAVLAAISGALLATRFPFELNYVLSIVSLFIATTCSFVLVEPRRVVSDERLKWADIGVGFRFIRQHRQLFIVSSLYVMTFAAFNFIDEFWQLYARDVEVPIYCFGIISTVLLLTQIPGQLVAPILLRFATAERWLHGIGWGTGIGFVVLGLYPGPSGLLLMAGMACLIGIVEPLYLGALHHRVPSGIRATTESSVSMLLHGGIILFGLVFVVGADMTLFTAFCFIGITVCLHQTLVTVIARREDAS